MWLNLLCCEYSVLTCPQSLSIPLNIRLSFTPTQINLCHLQSKLETQYKYYLACTSPIAISVAADFMERATLVRYCLNSVAQDWSSVTKCGEWVYQTDAIRTLISAHSATWDQQQSTMQPHHTPYTGSSYKFFVDHKMTMTLWFRHVF